MKAGDLVKYKNSGFGIRCALVLGVRPPDTGETGYTYVDLLWLHNGLRVCYAAHDLVVVSERK